MISLRPKQQNIYERTRQSMLDGHRAPLIVSPCGSGKTVIFSYFTKQIISKGKKVFILVHRDELLDQVSETLNKFNVGHSFIAANRYHSARPLVQVASVFTLIKRLKRVPTPDVIICDESHHASFNSTWGRIFQHYPKAWRIGVTASPIRLSGEPLGDIFDDLIIGPSVEELIKEGHLSDYEIYGAEEIDTSGVHTVAGDFNKKEIDSLMDKPVITGKAVSHYKRCADGKRALVYCCSLKHMQSVAKEFSDAGYRTGTIEGKMEPILRRRVVQNFKNGTIQILVSVNVVSEGFDLPAIECIIGLRPTQSLGLCIQQYTRGLRTFEGKKICTILDHAGNCKRLQWWPEKDIEWSLGGSKKRIKDQEKEIKIRLCKICYGANEAWRKECKYCKEPFSVVSREVEEVDGELKKLDIEMFRRTRKKEEGMARSLEELKELGKQRGYNPGWAYARHASRNNKVEDKW